MRQLDRVFYDTLQKELYVGDFWLELIAGVKLNPLPILPALGFTRLTQEPAHVGVIGAGLSGISAAYELAEMGFVVTVYEARRRVGGRTLSKRIADTDIVLDEGAEFVGANHYLWRYYAELLNIDLVDSNADYNFLNIPLIPRVPNSELTEQRLAAIATEVSKIMAPDWKSVDLENPWRSPNAKEFDNITLTDVLKRVTTDEMILGLLKTYLMADRGVNPDQISYLGFLVLVAAHGGDSFWLETERYRCPKGAQTLATSFYQQLAKTKNVTFRFLHEISSIICSNRGVTVSGGSGSSASALSELSRKHPSRFESLCRTELNRLSPDLGSKVKEVLIKCWPDSKFTGGSYSYPGLGDVTEGWPKLHDEIHPRLQLGGEPISFKFAYMEGALISGVLAATEIRRKYH